MSSDREEAVSSITFGNAELFRNGTIVTCNIDGEAVARVNLAIMGATDEVPLTLFLADRKFSLTSEETKAFLAGMPTPSPVPEVAAPEAEAPKKKRAKAAE